VITFLVFGAGFGESPVAEAACCCVAAGAEVAGAGGFAGGGWRRVLRAGGKLRWRKEPGNEHRGAKGD